MTSESQWRILAPTNKAQEMLDQLLAMQRDVDRLNWLAQREHSFEFCVPGDHGAEKAWLLSLETGRFDRHGKFWEEFDGDTMRDAIDAAMRASVATIENAKESE